VLGQPLPERFQEERRKISTFLDFVVLTLLFLFYKFELKLEISKNGLKLLKTRN